MPPHLPSKQILKKREGSDRFDSYMPALFIIRTDSGYHSSNPKIRTLLSNSIWEQHHAFEHTATLNDRDKDGNVVEKTGGRPIRNVGICFCICGA